VTLSGLTSINENIFGDIGRQMVHSLDAVSHDLCGVGERLGVRD
jgi:hypothetical protein